MKLYITDRYSATGRRRPNPDTVCKGRCEGMGFYPDMDVVRETRTSAADIPFVKCPDCNGTGLRPPTRRPHDEETAEGESSGAQEGRVRGSEEGSASR